MSQFSFSSLLSVVLLFLAVVKRCYNNLVWVRTWDVGQARRSSCCSCGGPEASIWEWDLASSRWENGRRGPKAPEAGAKVSFAWWLVRDRVIEENRHRGFLKGTTDEGLWLSSLWKVGERAQRARGTASETGSQMVSRRRWLVRLETWQIERVTMRSRRMNRGQRLTNEKLRDWGTEGRGGWWDCESRGSVGRGVPVPCTENWEKLS